jgi:hypothetical protein
MNTMKSLLLLCLSLFNPSEAFTVQSQTRAVNTIATTRQSAIVQQPLASRCNNSPPNTRSNTRLNVADLDTVALVTGQENYGLAIVVLGEAIWSFVQAPSFSHAKVLVPAGVAAVILCAVSGPMVTSGDSSSVTLGLEIATAVSAALGASYVARMAAPYSPSPKEAAFAGLLVAIAGFFSFSQNLVVDGFLTLPTLPSIPFPEIELGLGNEVDTSNM